MVFLLDKLNMTEPHIFDLKSVGFDSKIRLYIHVKLSLSRMVCKIQMTKRWSIVNT